MPKPIKNRTSIITFIDTTFVIIPKDSYPLRVNMHFKVERTKCESLLIDISFTYKPSTQALFFTFFYNVYRNLNNKEDKM